MWDWRLHLEQRLPPGQKSDCPETAMLWGRASLARRPRLGRHPVGEGRERESKKLGRLGGTATPDTRPLWKCISIQAPQPMPCGSKMNLPTSTLPKFPAHKNMSKVKWLLSAPNFGGSLSLGWGTSTSSPHLHSGPLGKAPASIPSLDSQQPYFPPPDVLPGASPYCSPL